jgi:hypothetical protein
VTVPLYQVKAIFIILDPRKEAERARVVELPDWNT